MNPSTLSRHFRRIGLTRQHMQHEEIARRGFRRFEAEAPMDLWQSDFQHTLALPDPLNPNRQKKAKLCLILDDHSRFVVHAQFYWDERMPSLEDTLKKAIEKHGIVIEKAPRWLFRQSWGFCLIAQFVFGMQRDKDRGVASFNGLVGDITGQKALTQTRTTDSSP